VRVVKPKLVDDGSPAFMPPPEFDDYVILHELGHGQMGRVFLAEDALLARPVAIKFIAGVEPDLPARQRFLMEARAAARIQHPNVVGIYRVGELGDRPYIVSELVRGKRLDELPTPMPWTDALGIAIELARGLAAAHRRGVVHCDIKPANAMLTDDGVAKLVDFGLARVVVEDADDTSGALVGTPDYMAPEVWAGRAPGRGSDVYSFGAVLYQLVTGKVPFADVAPTELARAVQTQAPPPVQQHVPDVDARLARVIGRCLERDPEARYASGEPLREALEQLQATRALVVRADENPYRGLRPFEAAHRGLFFGRSLEIGAVVDRLRTDAIVIVTGDSGVGKSSLCRAGVLPAIVDGALGAGRAWSAITMSPGRRPLDALASAFGDPTLAARALEDPETLPRELQRRAGGQGLVLFVDQMEELVTVAEPAQAAAFDAGLVRISEGVPGIRLITTVRADFLSRIAALPRLGGEISRLLYFVTPLPPERIHEVVTGPAAATGVELESPALIDELVDATVQAGSGGLPLLSFALAELWERRDRERDVITQGALDAMGGVSGALAKHGDTVLAGMAATDRAHVRRVLLRLVTAVGTRVRRTEAELSVSDGTRAALDALVRGRLLVVHHGEDGTTYELAHEVLVHGWGTLREWLDHDAEDRARRERVATAALEWQRAGRGSDLTWRGPRLVEAQQLDAADLTAIEREFIAASLRASRRRTWALRIGVVAVVAALITVYAVQRHLAAERLARAVGVELTAARDALARARRADADQRELAASAFARFDAGESAEGEELWTRTRATRIEAEDAYRRAGGHAEAALAKDSSRADVRAMLGDILYERALLAEAMFETARRDELIARLEVYDDGTRRARWMQPGTLAIRAAANTRIVLAGEPRELGTGSFETMLPVGAHVLEASRPGAAPIRVAVRVERGRTTTLPLDLPPAGAVPRDFVYVPAGGFLYGTSSDEDSRTTFFATVPLHARTTDAFLIARHEVTIADWLAYVMTRPASEHAGLLPNIPTGASGPLVIERDGAAWRIAFQPQAQRYEARWGEPIVYTGRTMHRSQDWSRFPITGVSAKDAEAYARWLDTSGRVAGARLCSELEWVRAARGGDERSYPGGDATRADAFNIDVTHGRAAMGYDEVGAHPASTSPYGIADASGNAFEWTRGEHAGEYVARGGSYYHDRKTANLANRYVLDGNTRDVTLGIRLCATPRP